MADKMLIDASHKEETRVVVTRGNRIEEFDFESEHKKQIKGNIYLARVTRVEPSLQAAFVEYGGNRHGFLAFSEIHPDYYQIPVADRQALVEAEAQAAKSEDEREAFHDDKHKGATRRGKKFLAQADDEVLVSEGAEDEELPQNDEGNLVEAQGDDESRTVEDNSAEENGDGENIEIVGAEDALEEVAHYNHQFRRDYKIQEVIKRRQILLVQVVKEERGNKGAALTTYLSLAGRYSVLMPNTARGGGISRKITNVSDRKRLKEVVSDLEVPKGMGIILRTAGANRTKVEIRRDYEYLMRMWENVRSLTLSSIAPALVYEEGSLIKRSIRDLYNKDIGEVLVAGEEGYREAKDFMRMLMPSHAKVVQPYRDSQPIFARNGIEAQLDRMLQPEVSLKSGGYLVLNQTEALVAIDVNSGRATKEHSVEDTALQTNMEAAEEIARQLRLRDLAGLVVIDFIDMDERRNIRAVEKKLKDCLKDDRARIQVGHISHFGLLEMSRQRLRASVLESTTQICPHCHGTGYVRSLSSLALHVMRSIEDYLLRHRGYNIIVRTPTETALYVLNHKRQMLVDFESRFGVGISLEADHTLGNQPLIIDKGEAVAALPPVVEALPAMVEIEEEELVQEAMEEIEVEQQTVTNGNGRRHRKGKRGGRDRETVADQELVVKETGEQESAGGEERDRRRKSKRRGVKRGRDYNGRARLPWPEPVGHFAASAQATARHLRRVRYAPHAEPVGDFFALEQFPKNVQQFSDQNYGEKQTVETQISDSIESHSALALQRDELVDVVNVAMPEVVMEETMTEAIVAIETDVTALAPTSAKPSRRKSRRQPEEVIAPPLEAETATVVTASEEEKPVVKKTRSRPKKQQVSAEKSDVLIVDAPVDEAPIVEKPKGRRAAKNKDKILQPDNAPIMEQNDGETPEPIVVSSTISATEKPKRMGWWQRKEFF